MYHIACHASYTRLMAQDCRFHYATGDAIPSVRDFWPLLPLFFLAHVLPERLPRLGCLVENEQARRATSHLSQSSRLTQSAAYVGARMSVTPTPSCCRYTLLNYTGAFAVLLFRSIAYVQNTHTHTHTRTCRQEDARTHRHHRTNSSRVSADTIVARRVHVGRTRQRRERRKKV